MVANHSGVIDHLLSDRRFPEEALVPVGSGESSLVRWTGRLAIHTP